MTYRIIATDYDGTLAHDGRVDAPTLDALREARGSGIRLVMVTGRELPDLFGTFEHADLFDRIVAENGALLYDPGTQSLTWTGNTSTGAPAPAGSYVVRVTAVSSVGTIDLTAPFTLRR